LVSVVAHDPKGPINKKTQDKLRTKLGHTSTYYAEFRTNVQLTKNLRTKKYKEKTGRN